jgi:hypothetical protein
VEPSKVLNSKDSEGLKDPLFKFVNSNKHLSPEDIQRRSKASFNIKKGIQRPLNTVEALTRKPCNLRVS